MRSQRARERERVAGFLKANNGRPFHASGHRRAQFRQRQLDLPELPGELRQL
jgi:hypothetical protein